MDGVMRLLGRKPQEVIEPIVYTEDDGFEEGDRGFFTAVEKAEGADGKTRPIVPRVLESRPVPEAGAAPAAPVAPRTVTKPQQQQTAQRPAAAPAQQSARVRDASSAIPPIDLLDIPPPRSSDVDEARLLEMADRLGGVLIEFGVKGRITEVRPGPVVTLFELEPAPGVRSSKVIALAEDIARAMSATSARVAVIPGRNAIGIELPNPTRETVYLRDLLNANEFTRSRMALPLALGESIEGQPMIGDLGKMPHLLIAGTTGSGKSVGINAMILSLMFKLPPEKCRFIMIDPKMLELSIYEGIPHLLAPWSQTRRKPCSRSNGSCARWKAATSSCPRWACATSPASTRRRKTPPPRANTSPARSRPAGTRKPANRSGRPKRSSPSRCRISSSSSTRWPTSCWSPARTSKAPSSASPRWRAPPASTSSPPRSARRSTSSPARSRRTSTRISYMVTTKIDSRTILGEQGAEQLLGMGDLPWMQSGGKITRVHGPFVKDEEVERVVNWLKDQGTPQYVEGITDEVEEEASVADAAFGTSSGDPEEDMYREAVAAVVRDKGPTTSYVQRVLRIGYNRAASMIERMEREGIISAADHAKRRSSARTSGVRPPTTKRQPDGFFRAENSWPAHELAFSFDALRDASLPRPRLRLSWPSRHPTFSARGGHCFCGGPEQLSAARPTWRRGWPQEQSSRAADAFGFCLLAALPRRSGGWRWPGGWTAGFSICVNSVIDGHGGVSGVPPLAQDAPTERLDLIWPSTGRKANVRGCPPPLFGPGEIVPQGLNRVFGRRLGRAIRAR